MCRLIYISEDKVQEIMTPEEKQKLFDAIGYEENIEDIYPKEVRVWYFNLF